MAWYLTCEGSQVSTVQPGVPVCLDGNGVEMAWTVTPQFQVEALDPIAASGAFGAGFFVMAMGWVVTKGARLALSFLK